MDLLKDTDGMVRQARDLIYQAYHKGYKAGVADGRKIAEEKIKDMPGMDELKDGYDAIINSSGEVVGWMPTWMPIYKS